MLTKYNTNKNISFSWKGRTFNQVTSLIKKNKRVSDDTFADYSYFLPRPLKIYRREIVTSVDDTCSSKISTSVDLINMPGGSIVNSSASTHNGLPNNLDINLTTNKYDLGQCNTTSNCNSPQYNALRRVRSSGIIKKQFDISKNNDSYATSTNQYLISRNRTFSQNQYKYFRDGDATVKPGDAASSQNIYSPNGINHCQKYHMTDTTFFEYQWVDRAYYTVYIPEGFYNLEDIRNIFINVMTSNKHYFINRTTNAFTYLLNIAYNTYTNKVELQTLLANRVSNDVGGTTIPAIFSDANYSLPLDEYNAEITTWSSYFTFDDYDITVMPVFSLNERTFYNAIGFETGKYPSNAITVNEGDFISQGYTNNFTFSSTSTPGIKPTYVAIYYKPNNPQFAVQGAVDASTRTARNRYNAITNNTALYNNAYGLSVANALAYGVPAGGYTWKDKIGYPLKKTPVFSKYSDEMQKCDAVKISGV